MSGGQRGIVAAGHPLTCAAAAGILRAGGNAFDAALAAGFAASLTEPMLTSLGGGGFLLAHPADGEGILIDFFSDAPGRGRPDLEPHLLPMTVSFSGTEQVFNIGFGSVAVPGTLAGLLHCHSRFARLPLADIVAPAVRLAREGVTLNAQQAYALGLLVPIHALTERGRALYSPEGRTPCEGERLVNPELADLDMERNLSPENRKVKTEIEIEKEQVIAKSGIDDGSYNDMRLLNEKYKAALKKLDYEQKSLQLTPSDEVKREADFAGRLVKQKVSSWPGRVYALVAAESDPFKCEQILKKECNELLEEISGGL